MSKIIKAIYNYIRNDNREIRKHYISTDYYAILGYLYFLWYCYSTKTLEVLIVSQLMCGVLCLYIFSRAFAKKNRGLIGMGILTSEFQFLALQYYWYISRFIKKELEPQWTAYLLGIAIAVYCISRAYCKKMEARTTTIL